MSVSISSGTFMVDETNTSGERSIWAMNVSELENAVYVQTITEGMTTAQAIVSYLASNQVTVTEDELTPILPDIEQSISDRVGSIREIAVHDAESILQGIKA